MSKDTKPPSRSADQFVVRLPDGMRDRIADAAKKAGRSMNAEIVHRLQQSLDVDLASETIYTPTVALVDGAGIDDAVRRRANALAKPENRNELQTIVAAILAIAAEAPEKNKKNSD